MEHFEKMIRFGGRFYARCPLGESRFDVATRVSQIFSQFFYDAQTKGIRDIIVVSHGVTIRAFVMMFMQYTPEWMEVEANPNNCSIRLLQGKHDRGTIYEGFSEYRPNTPEESTMNNSSDGNSDDGNIDGTNTNTTDTKNITGASVDNNNSDNEGNSTNRIEE
jgi:broad specificity phosphatase PhoE